MVVLLAVAGFASSGETPTQLATDVNFVLGMHRDCEVGPVVPVISVGFAYFESVARGRDNSFYTSEQCTGNVYRIRPNGKVEVMATIPYGVGPDPDCMLAGTLGVTVSDDGDVWVVVISWVPQSHGIWRIRHNGSAELAFPFPPDQAMIPNDLVFDPDDNLYVTESAAGAVWKCPPGGVATLWLQDSLLAPPPGGMFGANGIEYRDHTLCVGNTDQGTVLKIPVESDGLPGQPVVFASGLNGPDGLRFDAVGRLHTITAYGAQLIRFSPSGDWEAVLDLGPKGVSYPTSVAFGRFVGLPFGGAGGGLHTAYITNFIPLAGEPNVVKVNLCGKQKR